MSNGDRLYFGWSADRNVPTRTLPARLSPSPRLSGLGSPAGVVPGIVGQVYTDIVSRDLWVKMSDSDESGWRKIGKVDGTVGSALSGTGAPGAGLGNPGDTYVDLATGQLYWKGASGWLPQ